ncbi:helix-turn-helix domain-containing protein [Sanguibacter sp. A246]|uniref:helix-turn-helix domain-containing protein n=1 Tax=Sanguibacter sp. A246 TaxID=3457326 RepID=UPI003FD8C5F0
MEYRVSRPHQIGPAVRDARKKLGLTQGEVAQRAGVSRRFISELEAGSRPGAEFARVLAVLGALGRELRVADAPPASRDLFENE